MAVEWTNDQKRIIDFSSGNLLVAAGAGSGKTAVLTEHIVRKITDSEKPVDLDQLLVVTFTNAAAAQMKERIRSKLEKRIEENPQDENLLRQLSLVSCADISTIHSFCLKIIREQFFRLDIDPGFRLGDSGELKLMQNDILEDILEEQYIIGEQSFIDFRDVYSGVSDDEKIKKIILEVYNYSRSFPKPYEWLDEAVNEDFSWISSLNENLHIRIGSMISRISSCVQKASCEKLPDRYVDVLKSSQAVLELMYDKDDIYALTECMRNLSFENKPRAKKTENIVGKENIIEEVFNERKRIRDQLKALGKKYESLSRNTLEFEERETGAVKKEIIRLTRIFADKYSEKKRSLGICDFSDLEHMTLAILYDGDKESDAADIYAGSYDEILIDEYQDLNQIQEKILLAVSSERFGKANRFMVGDIKQSIYGFRMACPELFLEKYNTYSLTEGSDIKIELTSNFRSRSSVLESINTIFRKIMVDKLGGITYDDSAALKPGAKYFERRDDEADMELLLLEDRPADDELEETDMDFEDDEESREIFDGYTIKELQARLIGKRIIELINDPDFLVQGDNPEEKRRLKFGDIVILMRSLSSKQEEYVRALKELGIPVYVDNEKGYFDSVEVSELLNYLRIIDNPMQDIPLAAALRSAIGGFTPQELSEIRVIGAGAGKKTFYDCCMEARNSIRKLDRFLDGLNQYRSLSKFIPIHELILRIIEETGFKYYVCALPQGKKRMRNIEVLAVKARAYEKTSYRGIFNFIRYIDRIREYDVMDDFSSDGDAEIDAVRIMTIHKSKGLEFPVVFLAEAGSNFKKDSGKSSIVLDKSYGIGIDIKNPKHRYTIKTIKKAFVVQKKAVSELEEELRLLYVALTRAKEKIIITGIAKKPDELFEKWTANSNSSNNALDIGTLMNAASYLDWLMPALLSEERCMTGRDIPVICNTAAERIVTDKCSFFISRFELQELKSISSITPEKEQSVGTDLSGRLRDILEYRYPFEDMIDLRAVMSVSEIKKLAYENEGEEMLVKPAYSDESKTDDAEGEKKAEGEKSGARRGTAYHRVMELLDFSGYPEGDEAMDYLSDSVKQMIEKKQIEREDASLVELSDIKLLMESPIGRRMIKASKAGKLFKEYPFLMGISPREMGKTCAEDTMVLIRGIIDCYFYEDDELILLDYKTDRLNGKTGEQKLKEHYSIQIDYYKKALERALGVKVKEACLYSFSLHREIWV